MRLITDRTQANVQRLAQLSGRAFTAMTAAEQAEWSGNPLTAYDAGYTEAVNLLPPTGVNVKVRRGSITADATGTIVIGSAADFAGETVTLSAEMMTSGGSLTLLWSDGAAAGGSLSAAGSVTVTLGAATASKQLVLSVAPGYYSRVMLELGRERHDYVPYTEILPTAATKGAYNYSDLNRVERAVRDIAEAVGLTLTTKTDWSVWDVPTVSDVARYLGNIAALRDACGVDAVLPEDMDRFTYSEANTLERVLLECNARVDAVLRSGDILTGEVT